MTRSCFISPEARKMEGPWLYSCYIGSTARAEWFNFDMKYFKSTKGEFCFVLFCFVLVWFGLFCFVLDWFGLVWFGFSKELSFFIPMKISLAFIWGMVHICTRDGFFIILKKTSSQLICPQLYLKNFWTKLKSAYLRGPHSRDWISRGLPG